MPEEEKGEMLEQEQPTEMGGDEQQASGESVTLEQLQAELADTRKALSSANRESAQRRKKLEELEKLETERQEAELSEMEKLQKKVAQQQAEIERVQNEARQVRIKSAVISEANKLDFQDPEDAYRLIDVSSIEIGDKGEPEGVTELLKALADQKPYMIKKAKTVIKGVTNPGENVTGQGETDAQRRARLYGYGSQNLFTPEGAKQHGGGVVEIEQ